MTIPTQFVRLCVCAALVKSPALPLILLVPPQPIDQGLMRNPVVTAHQKGRQPARIGPLHRRMLGPGAQSQQGRAGNAQQTTHLPGAIDPRPGDAGRPEQGFELALGEGPGAGGDGQGCRPAAGGSPDPQSPHRSNRHYAYSLLRSRVRLFSLACIVSKSSCKAGSPNQFFRSLV
jgi:hypothetical protein